MILTVVILLCAGLIEHVSSIQCLTCSEAGSNCPVPLNHDAGDESNENEIESFNYDSDFWCQSDQSIDPRTGKQNIILRGIRDCHEINIPNRRVHCCRTNHCNKNLPPMILRSFADSIAMGVLTESTGERHMSSIVLIILTICFQIFLQN